MASTAARCCSRPLAGPVALQRRRYTPPNRHTWAKQHHRIRTPRPLVDRFMLGKERVEKEWWRERRVAPATFFGFPDVTKHGIHGGSLYVEQMDSVTLAVLADKCVKENITDPQIWDKFSWRAQQLSTRTHEPDLVYIFRAFARADWFDQNMLTTYLGRLHRRLPQFQLPDVAVLLEAFANPRFRQSTYLQRTLTHLSLLLQHRDDAEAESLARTCVALRGLWPLSPDLAREVLGELELLAEALLLRDLTEIGTGQAIKVIECYVTWGLLHNERTSSNHSNASTDLCWTLVRDLRGQLRAHAEEEPEDLAVLALAMATGGLAHEELWQELSRALEKVAHQLAGPAAAAAAFGSAKGGLRSPSLYTGLARRIGERRMELEPMDCARGAAAFLRLPGPLAQEAVLCGPILDRTLEIGLENFEPEALSLLLDALARSPPKADGVDLVAGKVLEVIHGRLEELTPRQLTSIVRSLGYLQPEVPEVLRAILDRAQDSASVDVSSEGALEPRHVAMLCQGIASQPAERARLVRLLPQVKAALAARPAAVTTAQLLASLAFCPASQERSAALDTCSEQLLARAKLLPAHLLVSLSGSLATLAAGGNSWKAPESLLQEVVMWLDVKRYDLPKGALGRASKSLEVAGAGPEPLYLEPQDV
eukprot:gnl/TRDRNA2_/TRDRNA2_85355_c0_seq1.p1 gnl/TRDRNA2_/TRDRNA2_85355_c0~~gnl/TRDRNA2_/TRDRNA2_85355_c0_seq1.p1  ORF type:complete len:668 (-),score=105.51 gnl/TRDRNA2_/TRDRNA2_85355_c0_seq1:36-1988(-)